MVRRMKKAGILIAGSYVTFLTFSVLVLVVFVALFTGGLVLRGLIGLEVEPLLPIASLVLQLDSSAWYLGIPAVASVACALWIASDAVDRMLDRIPLPVVILALSAVLTITGFVDAWYGISPAAKWLPPPPAEGHELAPETMTLEEIVYFTNVSPRVTTMGILACSDTMRRCTLEDPTRQIPPVKVGFYVRRNLAHSSFAEMRSIGRGSADPPETDALVAPFLGKHVQVTGSASNAAIRAHVSDLRLAASSEDSPMAPPSEPSGSHRTAAGGS